MTELQWPNDSREPGPDGSSWAADGLSAALFDDQGEWRAGLEVTHWYDEQHRDPVVSWVVSWPVPGGGPPYMYEAAIQQPARFAEDEPARAELVRLASNALSDPPSSAPTSFELPARPVDAEAWSWLLQRQISCWAGSFGELCVALQSSRGAGGFAMYRRAVEALGWAYTVDSSLQVLWRSLSEASQEEESRRTDERASASAAHNAAVFARMNKPYDAEGDRSFAAYHRRQQDQKAYERWPDLLMAGMFQSRFFGALSWVRGHMVHAAADLPMELQQYKPGVEPRWKFSHSSTFRRGDQGKNARKLYDQVLAGHDVVGGLGHLSKVFMDAERRLVSRLRIEESVSTNSDLGEV